MPLGTGDFEAIGPSSIPPASRAPVFHRSAPPPPPSSHGPVSYPPPVSYAPHSGYGQQMLSAPPPPNSLAPVAMTAAAGTGRHQAIGTGPHRTAETVMVRERPGMKAGFILVVLGALVGGVLGVGMRARQNQAEGTAAAVQQPAAPTQAANTVAGPAATTQTPPVVPPTAIANLPPGTVMVDPSKGTVVPVQPPVVVTPSPAKDGAKDDDKDKKKHAGGHKFGGGGHKAPAPAAAEPAPAATPRIAVKSPPQKDPEPVETKKPEPPKKPAAKDADANAVLQSAMKETQ